MKILVSVASKHGSTFEIGEVIATELRTTGVDVDVAHPNDVGPIDHYDAFVLGSGVYAGHWLADGREFAQRVAQHREGRPVWLFSSGPLGVPAFPDHDAVDVAHLSEATDACAHKLFAGRLDRQVLGFAERAIMHAVHAPEGDFRDWDVIKAWARDIRATLSAVV
ncbi:MAG: flavodoxin domain-containing protein [Ilumatobacteraceae bacterium]